MFCQSIRFTFDGQRVTGADTAASLGLEEGDTIEVFQVNTSNNRSSLSIMDHALHLRSSREVLSVAERKCATLSGEDVFII